MIGHRSRRRLTPLAVVLLLTLITTPVAAAGSTPGPTTVRSNDRIIADVSRYQADFPKEISFALKAHDAEASITDVKLLYSVVDQDQAALNVRTPAFTPDRSVQAQYHWDLAQSYIPPGVEIAFFWELRNESGVTLRTAPQRFLLLDNRFKWKRLQTGNVTAYWYRGDDAFGRAVVGTATQALASFRNRIGATLQRPVRLVIYGSQQDFQGILPPHSKQWIGGQSMSNFNLILLPIEPGNDQAAEMRRVLPHELSHLLTQQLARNPYSTVPTWLGEGLAVTLENGMEPNLVQSLQSAIKARRLISLRSLSGNFPTDSREASLAYAESNALILYILKTYGSDRLYRILLLIREGHAYEDAVKGALGVDVDKLDADFQQALYSGSFAVGTAAPTASTPGAQRRPGDLLHNVAVQALGALLGAVVLIYLGLGAFVHLRRRRRRAASAG